METVLITGGTGLVGRALTNLMIEKGYQVRWIGRKAINNTPVPIYEWDIETGSMDEKAMLDVDHIVHLAGASIAKKRWTSKYRKQITDSRIKSTELIRNTVKKLNLPIKTFISSSAIGYYGTKTTQKVFTEKDMHDKDFLAILCKQWEAESSLFTSKLQIRSVQIRTGIVLSKNYGALPKLINPIRKGIGAVIGTGKQYMPCIHISDLCKIYLYTIENKNCTGAYNATMPEQITNKYFTNKLASYLNKKIILPPVPKFILYAILGQRAKIILDGSPVYPKRLVDQKFNFQFPNIDLSISNLLS